MDIIQEVSQNFIDSAYDTNTNRAFPDVRDGLKPSMRASLWVMYKHGFVHSKPHVKSAKIDGLVAASIWPHGTVAIYETFARMSQSFTNMVPEVEFHGANGNVILGGDAIAADRYSEARLSDMAEKYMLSGVSKNAVDMQLNFSEDEEWPTVLPSVFPRLLVNGSQGIGVSIANSWCCHGLTDTINVLRDYLQENKVDNEGYLPDWPCGATIVNKDELPQINLTGKGRIVTEAKYEVRGKEIRFTEFPFQVYIEPLIEEIKNGIEQDKIHNISEVFNKSDKKQTLLTVTCSSAAKAQSVLDELFNFTSLRSQFNVNQVAIVGKTPKLLTLEEVCAAYVEHNLSCIKREHQYDLDKTKDRIEILEGLAKALGDIDGLVRLIKESESAAKAREKILSYGFTERQTDAILGMKLSRLAHLEVDEIRSELAEKQALAEKLAGVVGSQEKQKEILIERLGNLAKEFGGTRRTQVIQKEIKKVSAAKAKQEKTPEDVVICLDELGYVKSVPLGKFRSVATNVREEKTRTDRMVIFYSSLGKAYRLKASSFKTSLNSDKGTALGSLINLEQGETIVDFSVNSACTKIFFASQLGKVKVLAAEDVDGATQNKRGIPMMKLSIGDKLVSVQCMDDKQYAHLKTNNHELVFPLTSIRASGKASSGRVGIAIKEDEKLVSAQLLPDLGDLTLGKIGQRGQEL